MSFPKGFLWGAATAAHQVEGGNTSSDYWVMEHHPVTGRMFAEPSGDAIDHYRLFRQDIALLAELGLNSYRFSIEWARVEPEDGHFSASAIAHYREVLEACHEHGITPVVTLHHFSSPRWLLDLGGWQYEGTPERFAAYCRRVMADLGPLIPYACTINEANISRVIRRVLIEGPNGHDLQNQIPLGMSQSGDGLTLDAEAARRGTPNVGNVFPFCFSDKAHDLVRAAHIAARSAVRETSQHTKVGITLALYDVQALPGGEEFAAGIWADLFECFLPTVEGDDFMGVQNYSRLVVGPEGIAPVEGERTQMGYEGYPEALGHVLTRASSAGLPLMVTENGVATTDDTLRVEFIRGALDGVHAAIAAGADVRGYLYWSAFDNYEWMRGFGPTFGLIAVDRTTQHRTVKDSAHYLGAVAKRNTLT